MIWKLQGHGGVGGLEAWQKLLVELPASLQYQSLWTSIAQWGGVRSLINSCLLGSSTPHAQHHTRDLPVQSGKEAGSNTNMQLPQCMGAGSMIQYSAGKRSDTGSAQELVPVPALYWNLVQATVQSQGWDQQSADFSIHYFLHQSLISNAETCQMFLEKAILTTPYLLTSCGICHGLEIKDHLKGK